MPLSPEELRSVATDPVPGDAPAGRDVRLEPDFAALQAEIDKLSSMTGASGGVNWPLAETLAAKILRESSKDILAAVYLAIALEENAGPAGIASGAKFLADFVQAWWKDLLPPVKRMRARVNAVEWWRDRTLQLISKYQGPPLPQATVDAVQVAVDNLDRTLAEADGNLPSVREVARNLPALPVEVPAPAPAAGTAQAPGAGAAPQAAPGAPAGQGSASAAPPAPEDQAGQAPPDHVTQSRTGQPTGQAPAGQPQTGQASQPEAPIGQEPQAQSGQAAQPLTPQPQAEVPPSGPAPALPPPPRTAQAGEGPDSPGARAALKALTECADACLSYFAGHMDRPRYWELSRTRLWLPVSSLPPSENGRTRLLPPPPEILAGLKVQLERGAFRDALASAEDQRAAFVFWLDLDRVSAVALDAMNLKPCSAVLLSRASSFVASFAGLGELAFDDGTPFASTDTREWLASAGAGAGGPGEIPETAAYDRYLEGDAAKALSDLGEPGARPRTGRETLLSRAAEMRLYMRTARPLEAASLARWAVAECGRLELASYDPAAAAKAMSAAVFVLKGAGPEFRGDCLKALETLARCGPRAVSEISPAELS
ncbi:MAG: type VI secretion system domain-containing protein [Deltaproteobacteria bacterium]|jgi:type VI secretion system protein VasJ|nr:type VI secretion system domain-containing protein [Deltaproteobacteria bacterium]